MYVFQANILLLHFIYTTHVELFGSDNVGY